VLNDYDSKQPNAANSVSKLLSRGGKQPSLPVIGFLTDPAHAPCITGVSGFTHGTGFLDANGFIHYTRDTSIKLGRFLSQFTVTNK